jgi:cell wall-associated NlpC family hydrolase
MPGEVLARQELCTRRTALKALSACGAVQLLGGDIHASGMIGRGDVESSYGLEYSNSLEDLVGDLEHTERGDPWRQSDLPYSHWYTTQTRHRLHAWGPRPRHYAPLANLRSASVQWKRERVIATAARFLGYGYQHHHIPDWDPPAGWPWKETCVGHNGKGVDCSNLTSFVYNQGFGIRMTSAVGQQSEIAHALEAGHEWISIQTVELPESYEQRRQALRTGDLVYICGRERGPITHVVIWVGSVGRAASGVPLVIDSHGSGVEDDDGQSIPCGVRLRPFREHSWYNRCASHAHRIFHEHQS